MKSIILVLSLCVSCFVMNAETLVYSASTRPQETDVTSLTQSLDFTFNANATFSTSGDKPYVVYPMPGKSKAELYKCMLVGISKLFSHPDQVIYSIEDEMIVINGMSDYCIEYRSSSYAFTYTIRFLFKDGKIRIDTPSVNAFVTSYGEQKANVEGWIKTQGNYETVKGGFEQGIKNAISVFLANSFSKEETEW